MAKSDNEKPEATNREIDSDTKCNAEQQSVEKANKHPDWLPDGWSVEIKTRKSGSQMGSGYKCYIDPLNGHKFYSKPEVLRFLETVKDNSCTPKETVKDNSCAPKKETVKDNSCTPKKETVKDNSCTPKKEIKKNNSCTPKKEKKRADVHSPNNVVVEKSTVEDLPPGWIKEVKIRKGSNGTRKDPFYKDPVTGYVFRSKKDVIRYLESGDIGKCAYKPSRGQIQDEDNLTPSPAAKRQKLKQSAPKQQLFIAKELPDDDKSRKGQDVNVPSGTMDAPEPTGESVVKMQSLDDGSANPPEMKKTTDPGSSSLLRHETMRESEKMLCADGVLEKDHVVNMIENGNEKNYGNHSISKNKEFNVGHRFSPRLAGSEPVQSANNNHNPEIGANSSKSSNKKKPDIPRRASKRLAGFEHERMNSISCEKAPNYKSKRSKDEVKAELQQSEGGLVTEISNHAPINRESGNKRRKSPEIPPNADNQLKKLEDGEMDDKKSESQLSFAFHYSWSDPCLEFAINTLTSVLPPEDSVDNGPITVPKTDTPKTLVDNVGERSRDSQSNSFDKVTGSRDKKSVVRSNKSQRKKELKVPMRLSKRLAGLEPEVPPSEKAVEYSTKKSGKEEPTAAETAISTNEASDHLDGGEETKPAPHASDSLTTEVLGESSSKIEKSCDAQTVPKEQLQKVEVENTDERSGQDLPLPFGDSWSDPCLEFAIKTLTGALPVDAAVDILPVMTPVVDDLPNKEMHGRVMTSINGEAQDKSNQSQDNKQLNMDGQPSKLLLGQPELRTSSTSYENAPKFTTIESHSDEGNIMKNLDGEPQHVEAGNVSQVVHHSRNINTVIHEEPIKENGQVVEGEFGTTERPPLQTETLNHDNTELQFCNSFMNSWSDPCLEFAFKTLTGVIPVEENLGVQGCFQEPANSHERRDVGSTLPDFGSSSFSPNDISFHYDMGVKSMPGQQSSMNSSFLSLEKASLQDCSGVDPQKHYFQYNQNFQRR